MVKQQINTHKEATSVRQMGINVKCFSIGSDRPFHEPAIWCNKVMIVLNDEYLIDY